MWHLVRQFFEIIENLEQFVVPVVVETGFDLVETGFDPPQL